ncbi:hypothetical protein BGZ63DRAFT_366614 [Mariannaea sp. PMI_226]|nr:hypothetical protein BGZ63DRAFT_366614 [Mariannaea sp. PMI_226]
MPPTRITKENGLATLACTECRKQHLKCDAKKPTCSRCLQGGLLCHYQPSRRGGRRKPRHEIAAHRDDGHGHGHILGHASAPATTTTSLMDDSSNVGMHSPSMDRSQFGLLWPAILPRNEAIGDRIEQTGRASWTDDDRYLRMFYENFHTAHPILVPNCMYAERAYPHFLQLVVNFVGAHYVPSSPCQQLKAKVAAELAIEPDQSPCMVQAWLIYSIVLHARGELPEAREAFAKSSDLALKLGMNRADFVTSSPHPERSIEAESLRRTWWELYVIDILMAIPLRTISFRCSTVPPEVPLPCEEAVYSNGGDIPEPRRILDFKRRVFAAEDVVFSSFSYRIEAITILCRVLVLNRLRDYHRDHLQAIENALVSWNNHLPVRKLDIVDSYGNIDEMMFQAHLIIAHASMLLHLPRSDFQTLLSQPDDPFWPLAPRHASSTFTRSIHSIKATEASRRVSDSISVCPNIQKHTPFVIPALVLCAMIQLAISTSHSEECFDHHCNRVTLVLGCLKNMKRTWSLADSAYHRVRLCASETLSGPMDKWNAEPLSKSIAFAQATPSDSDRTFEPPRPPSMSSEGQDAMLNDLVSSFIDPTCYNPSFFNSLSGFEMN